MNERVYFAIVENVERTPFLDVIMRMNKNYGNFKNINERTPVYNMGNSRIAVSIQNNEVQIAIKNDLVNNKESTRQLEEIKSNIENKLKIDLVEAKNGA
mgnify:CR=1 FL=1